MGGDFVTQSELTASLLQKVDKQEGKGLSTEDYTAEEKQKLGGIASGATQVQAGSTNGTLLLNGEETTVYTHPVQTASQPAFIKVGNDSEGHVTLGEAVSKEDITALGVPAQDTTYLPATDTEAGLMTAGDKQKLDSIEQNANAYQHPATHPMDMITGLGDAAGKNVGTAAGTVAAGDHSHAGVYQPVGDYVPSARTVNGKPLSADIVLQASEVGADPAGSADTVQQSLTSHLSDTSNPHNVTAAQVGADPAGSAASAAGAVQTALNTHTGTADIHRSITWQTVTLTSSGWSGSPLQQTVAVSGITVSGDGLVKPSPTAGDSFTAWGESEVEALPLSVDGQLTFQCETAPAGNITVLVEVVK